MWRGCGDGGDGDYKGFLGGYGVVWQGCGDGGDGDYEGFLGGVTWFEVVMVVRLW